MPDLPADREKALAAIAGGWGRTATSAHPNCLCGKPRPEQAEPKSPPLDTISDPEVLELWRAYWRAHRDWRNRPLRYQPRDCPVHRPGPQTPLPGGGT